MPLQLGDEGEEMHSQLARQTAMDSALCSLMLDIKAVRGAADRKVERLRAVLREDESRALTHFAEVSASELGFNPTVSFLLVIVFPGALSPVYSRHLHTPMLTTCDCLQKCENAHTYAEDHQHSALTRQIGYDSFELSLHDLLPDGTGIFYQQSDLSNFRGADTVLCDSWSTHNSYTLLYTVLLQFSLPFCLSFSPLLCAPPLLPPPQPLALPLNPHVHVLGVLPDQSSVFKSALHPLKLTFQRAPPPSAKSASGSLTDAATQREGYRAGRSNADGRSAPRLSQPLHRTGEAHLDREEPLQSRRDESRGDGGDGNRDGGAEAMGAYRVIFKKGDDLRQDQLVGRWPASPSTHNVTELYHLLPSTLSFPPYPPLSTLPYPHSLPVSLSLLSFFLLPPLPPPDDGHPDWVTNK